MSRVTRQARKSDVSPRRFRCPAVNSWGNGLSCSCSLTSWRIRFSLSLSSLVSGFGCLSFPRSPARLAQTGEIAIWTLGAVLSLSPLRVLFPRSRLVNALNRHRRVIGVSACVYGLIHFGFHLLYEGDAQAIARSFSKPFIWFGLAILAATSNSFSIRKLGGKNWKRVHRLAYAAAALLIYHQAIAGKGHWNIARWLLFSLLALQIARVTKTLALKFGRKRLSHHRAVAVYLPKTAGLGASASTHQP